MPSEKASIPLRLSASSGLLGSGERLLDVGCGSGRLFSMVRGRFGEMHGLDKLDGCGASTEADGAVFRRADLDAGAFPYPDAFFDKVCCADVLEHVLDPNHLLAECRRILRPSGCLVLTTPNIRFYSFLWSLAFRGSFPRTSADDSAYDGGHLHYFTFSDVLRLLRAAGFERLEEFGLYRWETFGLAGSVKDRLKSLFGGRFKREFFSGAVVVRAWKGPA